MCEKKDDIVCYFIYNFMIFWEMLQIFYIIGGLVGEKEQKKIGDF